MSFPTGSGRGPIGAYTGFHLPLVQGLHSFDRYLRSDFIHLPPYSFALLAVTDRLHHENGPAGLGKRSVRGCPVQAS